MKTRLRCALLVSVLSMTAECYSLCEDRPSDSNCVGLQVSVGPSIARDPAITIPIDVLRLLPEAMPTATLKIGGDSFPLTIVEPRRRGGIDVRLRAEDLARIPLGPASLRVELGAGLRSGEAATWLYAPPRWGMTGATAQLDYTPGYRPLAVFIHKRVEDQKPSLFVTEEVGGGTGHQLARYDLAGSQLIPDSTYANNTSSPGNTALYGLTTSAILQYVYLAAPGRKVLAVRNLSDGLFKSSSMDPQIPDLTMPLFASEQLGELRLLAGDGKFRAFRYDSGINYADQNSSIAGLPPLRALVARRVVFDGVPVNAGALDENGKPWLFQLNGDDLSVQTELTIAAEMKLKDMALRGLFLADLDRDGLPDLVTTLATSAPSTVSLVWLPYRGDKQFGQSFSFTLPQVMESVEALTVGDLDLDNKPDLVIATMSHVYVYLNDSL